MEYKLYKQAQIDQMLTDIKNGHGALLFESARELLAQAEASGIEAYRVVAYLLAQSQQLSNSLQEYTDPNSYQSKVRRGEVKPAYRKDVDTDLILMFKRQGASNQKLAEMFGVTPRTIRNRLKAAGYDENAPEETPTFKLEL